MAKVKTFKNGAYTSIERDSVRGMYLVKVYSRAGYLIDRVVCDDYRNARDYLRSFNGIARNA
jgi:hypothetical protein